MKILDQVIGVCSWSLRCSSIPQTVETVKGLGLAHMQLALGGLIDAGEAAIDDAIRLLEKEQIQLTAGMIGFAGEDYSTIITIRQTGGLMPDGEWEARRKVIEAAAKLGKRLGLGMVSAHIGFVPGSNEQEYGKMVSRVREVAGVFGEHGQKFPVGDRPGGGQRAAAIPERCGAGRMLG